MLGGLVALVVIGTVGLPLTRPAPTERPPAPPLATESPQELTDEMIAAKFGPAVFRVEALSCEPILGTAFAVDDHHLITNWHVIAAEKDPTLASSNGERLIASVLSSDSRVDLAVLRSEVPLRTSVDLGRESPVRIGTHLAGLGYPAPAAEFSLAPGSVLGFDEMGLIRSDLPADAGSSGGPVFTSSGALAGVVVGGLPGVDRVSTILLPADWARIALRDTLNVRSPHDPISCAEQQGLLEADHPSAEAKPVAADSPTNGEIWNERTNNDPNLGQGDGSRDRGADHSQRCHPSYIGACLDPSSADYDCVDGRGDGPDYTGEVEVVGRDVYDLDDNDADNIGCNGQRHDSAERSDEVASSDQDSRPEDDSPSQPDLEQAPPPDYEEPPDTGDGGGDAGGDERNFDPEPSEP